jgi:hypothetical protein
MEPRELGIGCYTLDSCISGNRHPRDYFCQVMVSPAEKTRGHICPFYTMVIDTHVWLGISGKTGEKFRKDV